MKLKIDPSNLLFIDSKFYKIYAQEMYDGKLLKIKANNMRFVVIHGDKELYAGPFKKKAAEVYNDPYELES